MLAKSGKKKFHEKFGNENENRPSFWEFSIISSVKLEHTVFGKNVNSFEREYY
jgi:hypothetical protein